MNAPLEDIQDSILESIHAGEPIDRRAVLDAHPEFAADLERFFSVVSMVEMVPPKPVSPLTRLGDFRIVKEIGRGGMGVVYEAEQVSLGRSVALKILPPALCLDPRLMTRFRREAEAAARLNHPNIVPVHSFGEEGGVPFYAMELVRGRSLAEVIEERRHGDAGGAPEDPSRFRTWALDITALIADALEAAHRSGVLHRDVKPSNVLIDAEGRPRLTDFGLALDLDAASLTVTGEVLGSPRYMSPEQAQRSDRPLDARTDVYSLGVTVYELLTSRSPHEGLTAREVLAELGRGTIRAPREFDSDLSADADLVIMRALRSDPEQRYASPADFAVDLRAARDGKPVAARQVRRSRRRKLWIRRLTQVAIAATLVIGAFAAFEWLRPEDPWPYDTEPPFGPTVAEVEQLLDGVHPEGAQLIERWIGTELVTRNVWARSAPPKGTFKLRIPWRWQGEVEGVDLMLQHEVSVNRGPWQTTDGRSLVVMDVAGHGSMSAGISLALDELLTDASASSFELGVRVQARLVDASVRAVYREVPDDVTGVFNLDEPVDLAGIESGTAATWVVYRNILLFDEYPADYPSAVTEHDLDQAMLPYLAPDRFNASIWKDSVSLFLQYKDRPWTWWSQLPLALAMEVDLVLPESDRVVHTARVLRVPEIPTSDLPRSITSHVRVGFENLATISAEGAEAFDRFESQRASREFEGNAPVEFILRFRPSRDVAFDSHSTDRYWGRVVDLPLSFDAEQGWTVGEPRIHP